MTDLYDSMYDSMYERANAFYKSLGECPSTHPLWLGAEMPNWFFLFLLQHNTLIFVLRCATRSAKSSSFACNIQAGQHDRGDGHCDEE